MTIPARARYSGYRFPAQIISHAVWLYFRFPLGLRMVEELLAARGIIVSHETMRQWARKFGQQFANGIRRRLPRIGDKWHLDEVVLKIAGDLSRLGATLHSSTRLGFGRERSRALLEQAETGLMAPPQGLLEIWRSAFCSRDGAPPMTAGMLNRGLPVSRLGIA